MTSFEKLYALVELEMWLAVNVAKYKSNNVYRKTRNINVSTLNIVGGRKFVVFTFKFVFKKSEKVLKKKKKKKKT